MSYEEGCYGGMTDIQKMDIASRVQELDDILPGIYLHFGTLLGSVRGSGVIDHDNDIDVAYLSKYHTKKEVEDEIKDIYNMFIRRGILAKYFIQDNIPGLYWTSIEDLDIPIKKPFGQCHVIIRGYALDLYTEWIDEDGNYMNCIIGNLGKEKDILPLRKSILNGIELNIPNNSESILETIYGDWRTPVNKKSQIRKASFLKEWGKS